MRYPASYQYAYHQWPLCVRDACVHSVCACVGRSLCVARVSKEERLSATSLGHGKEVVIRAEECVLGDGACNVCRFPKVSLACPALLLRLAAVDVMLCAPVDWVRLAKEGTMCAINLLINFHC